MPAVPWTTSRRCLVCGWPVVWCSGCFWGVELSFQRVPGVKSTRSAARGRQADKAAREAFRSFMCLWCCACQSGLHQWQGAGWRSGPQLRGGVHWPDGVRRGRRGRLRPHRRYGPTRHHGHSSKRSKGRGLTCCCCCCPWCCLRHGCSELPGAADRAVGPARPHHPQQAGQRRRHAVPQRVSRRSSHA